MIDQDRACAHQNFDAVVEVNRLQRSDEDPEIVGYSADLRVRCRDCDEPFRWTGLEVGLSPAQPMVSLDGLEMHAPLRPSSSDPDFGLGLPGFHMRVDP